MSQHPFRSCLIVSRWDLNCLCQSPNVVCLSILICPARVTRHPYWYNACPSLLFSLQLALMGRKLMRSFLNSPTLPVQLQTMIASWCVSITVLLYLLNPPPSNWLFVDYRFVWFSEQITANRRVKPCHGTWSRGGKERNQMGQRDELGWQGTI